MKQLITLVISYITIMFALCYMLIYSFGKELEHQQIKEENYKNYIINNQND